MRIEHTMEKKAALKTPTNIEELLNDGVEFEVDTDFNGDNLYDNFMEDNYGGGDEDEETLRKMLNPWNRTFDELRQIMKPISEFIHKRITTKGVGEPVSGINKRLTIHYNAFFENDIKPFDSTTLRQTPFQYILGSSEVLPGLDIAVNSMCVGEEAQFLISYKLLFGELGCPPRIRPRADALFVIRLDSCTDVGNAQALSNLESSEHRSFAVVKNKIAEIRNYAKDCFRRGLISNAIHKYLEAVEILQMCELIDEKERNEQQATLVTLYTSLAVCYNRKEQPKDACQMVDEARLICNVNQHAKLLYQEGRALYLMGEYDRSRESFVRAQQLRPNDKHIQQAIRELNESFAKYRQTEKDIWSRALNITHTKTDETSKEEKEFKDDMKQVMKSFLEDEKSSNIGLPHSLLEKELLMVKELADELNLKFTLYLENNKKHYSLKK